MYCTEGVWWPCYIWGDVWCYMKAFEKLRLFLELQLTGLVSWESPGKYFMIGHSLWNLFRPLSSLSLSIAQQCGVQLRNHTLNYWIEMKEVLFFSWRCFDCNLAYRRSVAALCMLFKIKCNAMHPLSGALHLPFVPARYSWCFACSSALECASSL